MVAIPFYSLTLPIINYKVMRKKYLLISLFLLMGTFLATAQEKKNFTLEDIYKRPTFSQKAVRGMNSMRDGKTYGNFEKGALNIYNYKTGKLVKTLFKMDDLKLPGEEKPVPMQNYELSDDESKILVMTDMESIYRHSFTATYYVFRKRL